MEAIVDNIDSLCHHRGRTSPWILLELTLLKLIGAGMAESSPATHAGRRDEV